MMTIKKGERKRQIEKERGQEGGEAGVQVRNERSVPLPFLLPPFSCPRC